MATQMAEVRDPKTGTVLRIFTKDGVLHNTEGPAYQLTDAEGRAIRTRYFINGVRTTAMEVYASPAKIAAFKTEWEQELKKDGEH
jgi:hypothetical protein